MNLWVSGGEDGSKYSLDATPPYSSPLSFFHRRFPSTFALQHAPFAPTNQDSIILRIAEFQFTLLVPSFILVEHGSKRKHPIDCVPSTVVCHFSLNELRKIQLPKNVFERLEIYLSTRH